MLIQPQAPRAILWPPARGRLGKSAKPGDPAPPSPGLTVTNALDAVSLPPSPCFWTDAWHLRKLKSSWPGAHLGLAGLVILHVSHDGQASPTVSWPRQCAFLGDSGYSRAKHDPDDTRRKSRLEPRKSWPWIGRSSRVSEREAMLLIPPQSQASERQRRVQ